MSMIKKFVRDESGAAAAEYALILAVVCVAISASAIALGANIGTAIQDAADLIVAPAA